MPVPLNGRLIAYWREKRGYTQEQLASLVGVSRPAVAQWENGGNGITEPKLRRLTEKLNLTMVQFYSAERLLEPETEATTVDDEPTPVPRDTMAASA